MGDPRDSVEWASAGAAAAEPAGDETPGAAKSNYLRLWFTCSGQYARAYRSASGAVYLGRCPKCGKTARFPVGEGGTSERFFKVSC